MDWLKLKQKILQQPSFVDKKGDTCKEIVLGATTDLTPSGKHRVFGRRSHNQDSPGSYRRYVKVMTGTHVVDILHEAQKPAFKKDERWFSDLLEEAEKHRLYVKQSDDKERTSIVVGIKIKDRDE